MPTLEEKESERSPSPRALSDCKPLIDAATKDLFRKNAFRITGFPVNATAREIAKHAAKLTMLAELGQDPHTQSAAFPIQPPPSLDEIREAIQNLRDPEKRLIDEFFWFWPEEFENSQSDQAMQALAKGDSKTAVEIWTEREKYASGITAKHNLALVYHVCALDWENYSLATDVEAERRQKINDYWEGAFTRWDYLETSEQFWEKVLARIRQLNEPNLSTGFVRRMRATLPEALDKINAEFALAFAESGKTELARLHIRYMHETNVGLDNVEKTASLVLTPAKARLHEQIQRARTVAKEDPAQAKEATRTLIEHALPLVEVFDLFFGERKHVEKEVLDETATTCVNCLVSYQQKTEDNQGFVDILQIILRIAQDVETRQRIETNIEIGKTNIRYDTLKPVDVAPSLFTFYFIGTALYGHTDEISGSYMATYYFVVFGIPLYPICRYRVASIGDGRYRFFGRAPLRRFDKWHLAISAGASLFAFLIIAVSSTKNTPSVGSPTQPSSSDGGNVYRVPNNVRIWFEGEKKEIELEREAIQALETDLNQLDPEIERDRQTLDDTSQAAVDAFNAKVAQYNELQQRLKVASAAFDERVNNYNAKLRDNQR
jgi:hypothetical protein